MWLELTAQRAADLAATHGTPFYVYDLGLLQARAKQARALPGALLYGVKANPHPALLRGLHGHVDGLDVCSGGEVERALACGWAPQQLSFVGPGKTAAELEGALARGVLISAESLRELEHLAALAAAAKTKARVRLRMNPALRVHSYRVPMTGGPSPFGIDAEDLGAAADLLRRHEAWLDFDGLHVHAGAQCTSVGGVATAAGAALDLAARFHREHALPCRTVNFGGGFGALSPTEELDVAAVARRLEGLLAKHRADTGATVEAVFEPGRWLVGPAGLYVARVVSEKRSRGTHFVVLDGGFNHHLGATQALAPLQKTVLNLSRPGAPQVTCTVVGPLCTPLDSMGEVTLAEPRVGDLVAVPGAGAYGYTFSPLHFLSHPQPAEVVLAAPE